MQINKFIIQIITHIYIHVYTKKRYEKENLKNSLIKIFLDLHLDNVRRLDLSQEKNRQLILRSEAVHCFINYQEFLEKGFDAEHCFLKK